MSKWPEKIKWMIMEHYDITKITMSWRLLQMDWGILLHCDLFCELF